MRRLLIAFICVAILAVSAGAALASDITYVVAPGDNLSRIAARFGVSTQVLAATNNIVNPNRIYAGQVLRIPIGTPPAPPPPPYQPQVPPVIVAYYTVRPGDTLSGIARWYGVAWTSIASANGIWNPNHIYAGQVLAIPRQPTVYNYTVQYGDTLARIAARYGTTWSAIAGYNGLYNPNVIWAGMHLRIPVY